MKRLIGVALCAALVLMAPAVQGATVYTEGFFEYRVQDGGVVICGYFGRDSVVTVPDSIAGYPVSVIWSGAFSGCGQVSRINLPGTIMTIEEGAIGQEQTVTYVNGTSGTTGRDPKPTPTAAPSVGGDRYDEDVYVPDVPAETQQPTASPVPSASPEVTASPEASATPAPSASPAASVPPEVTVEPATSEKPKESAAVSTAQPEATQQPAAETEDAVQTGGEQQPAETGTVTAAPAEDAVAQPVQGANADEPQQVGEDKPDKLTVIPVEEKNGGGWILIALGAAAGCAAVLTAILMIRKRNGK